MSISIVLEPRVVESRIPSTIELLGSDSTGAIPDDLTIYRVEGEEIDRLDVRELLP